MTQKERTMNHIGAEQSLREIPAEERPRERLLAHGSAALSDAELLAILLRTGRPGTSVIQVARNLLRERGGLRGMPGLTFPVLRRRGVGAAKAATVLAAVELGCRLARNDMPQRRPMSRPVTVANYLNLRYSMPDQEVMGALFLDLRHRLIGEKELFRGTLSRAAAEPRAVLREALVRGAAAMVLFHTHPNGEPVPSNEDVAFTHSIVAAGEAVGVRVVDHMILGADGRWLSMRQRQGW
jgi:DNA repair protein RadC